MAKVTKKKTVHYVYEWESKNSKLGTVSAHIQSGGYRSVELQRDNVDIEMFEVVGQSLINILRKTSFY